MHQQSRLLRDLGDDRKGGGSGDGELHGMHIAHQSVPSLLIRNAKGSDQRALQSAAFGGKQLVILGICALRLLS